jgi:hypothetical protein
MTRRLPAIMTPDLTNFYVSYLFSMAFHSGSYAMEQTAYAPGEWTRWRIVDGEEGSAEMERAFIARTGDGSEWWRVKYSTTSDGETSVMVLEGLFSNDKTQLVRLRTLMPGATEPAELPVREGAFGYVAPIPLTAESMEGAKVGVERVVVPAGTFSTNHLRYGALGGGNLDWWLTDSVPGGMVKYSVHGEGETPAIVELTSFGKGAKSELGVDI